jgi:hypothetical protein
VGFDPVLGCRLDPLDVAKGVRFASTRPRQALTRAD